ncbi:MAG: ABC transporter substrate-binding protein [Candidatus Binatia bacterium]
MKRIVTFLLAMTPFLMGLTGAEARQSPRIPRIGILILKSGPSETVRGLQHGLRELGYREGKNILLLNRSAKGDRQALRPRAIELVSKKVDLIFTTGSGATQAAKAATKEIPIVFRHPLHPVELGLVKSMTRPGGNLTGVAGLSVQIAEKRLGILREILPRVRRVLIFYDSNNPISRGHFAFAEEAAMKLGLKVAEHPVKSAEELKITVTGVQKREGDALYYVSDSLVGSQAKFIFKVARRKKLPTMFDRAAWAAKGSLAAYGPNYYLMGRQAASLVDKILKGAMPQNLPVEQANKFDLAINLRTASIIGVTIPLEVVKRADKVIR